MKKMFILIIKPYFSRLSTYGGKEMHFCANELSTENRFKIFAQNPCCSLSNIVAKMTSNKREPLSSSGAPQLGLVERVMQEHSSPNFTFSRIIP